MHTWYGGAILPMRNHQRSSSQRAVSRTNSKLTGTQFVIYQAGEIGQLPYSRGSLIVISRQVQSISLYLMLSLSQSATAGFNRCNYNCNCNQPLFTGMGSLILDYKRKKNFLNTSVNQLTNKQLHVCGLESFLNKCK